jgi:cobalt-zinc-cadmium resistance protein CzcA
MTPEEVEARITVPIEQEMLGIPHQRILRSHLQVRHGRHHARLRGRHRHLLGPPAGGRTPAGVMGNLPPGATGGLAPITTPLGEMFMFTIEGPDVPGRAAQPARLDRDPSALRTVPGVADVNSLGGEVRSFEVVPDPGGPGARRGLTLPQLQAPSSANNRNDGAGRLSEGEETLLVRAEGSHPHLDDVRAIVLRSANGGAVRVGDVATVRIGALTRYGASPTDGEGEAVEGLVLGLRGANAASVDSARQGTPRRTGPPTAAGREDRGLLRPQRTWSNARSHTVTKALGEAIVLVLVLLLLFPGQPARGAGGGADAAAGRAGHLHC